MNISLADTYFFIILLNYSIYLSLEFFKSIVYVVYSYLYYSSFSVATTFLLDSVLYGLHFFLFFPNYFLAFTFGLISICYFHFVFEFIMLHFYFLLF